MLLNSVSFLENSLNLAILIVCAAIIIVSIVASIARISGFFRYHKNNRVIASCNMSGAEAARKLLDSRGMQDVQVKQASFFRAFIWGNSYAPNKKTIFLRRGIINKGSMTSVALACQKVGLAEQHKNGDKKYKTYAKLVPYCPFIPVFYIPLVILSLILDAFILKTNGLITLFIAIAGIVLYICAFVLIILNVPVEKKATAIALEIMKETSLLNDGEIFEMQKLFKDYITKYVTDMIIAILQIVKYILQILLMFSKKKK